MQDMIGDTIKWFSTLYDEAEREFNVEQPDLSNRNPFQRDRDRILSSKAFCRLDGKAQVFYADSKDHIRNRLTHSLGVRSLADNISRKLKLNCDLVEAIALGHDLGHTPYGHIGERILNQIMNGCIDLHGVQEYLRPKYMGFKHNWQGYRLVSELETYSDQYPGLNLTKQTIWGIVNHTRLDYKECHSNCLIESRCNGSLKYPPHEKCRKKLFVEFYKEPFATSRPDVNIPLDNCYWTPEAIVVAVADEIDQRIHDVADAYEVGIISLSDIIYKFRDIFGKHLSSEKKMEAVGDQLVEKARNNNTFTFRSGAYHIQATFSRLIADLYIENFIRNYHEKMISHINKYSIKTSKEYKKNLKEGNIPFYISDLRSDSFWESDTHFHDYLKSLILNCHRVQLADGRASLIIRKIFKALVSNPMQLPDKVLRRYVSTMEGIPYSMTVSVIDDENNAAKTAYKIRSSLIEKYLRTDDGAPYEKGYSVLMRTICDFISGMTDQFAESYYHELYGIKDIKLELK